MPDRDMLAIKRLTDLKDQVQRKEVMRKLLRRIEESTGTFYDAFRSRRNKLLEINAVYRNKSYLDANRVDWQTRSFYPLSYDAVETKTSLVHQALFGDRLDSPFTAIGRTAEDHMYATVAEDLLNNTMDRIGFFETSEEVIRSTVKYGLGVYYYGWERREEDVLWREALRNEKGEIERTDEGYAILQYRRMKRNISQPFVRAIDIVDHFGWDPTAKKFDKWACDYVFIIDEMTPEQIYEAEESGEFFADSFENLKSPDPHGFDLFGDVTKGDQKEPQIRRDEGVSTEFAEPLKPSYRVVRWFGWFDVDGDNKREFIEVAAIPSQKLILKANERLIPKYPVVDVPYSRSLHTVTPWGVIDPVLQLQYDINERRNQRGDAIKHVVNPQLLINVDKILEDHAYVSSPGAMHPFYAGDEDVQKFMTGLQMPTNGTLLSFEDEDRDINQFSRTTGVADLNRVLSSANKDTPASTVISIFNQQQAGASMIVNGILNRHGVLGLRIFNLIQLFGDEEFVIRSTGKNGVEFRRESMENILGEYDIKVSTSSFFGNRAIEVQELIQLRPLWQGQPHIDMVEVDKLLLERLAPKRLGKILVAGDEIISAAEEQVLFLMEQGEGIKINMQENIFDLRNKLRIHQGRTRDLVAQLKDGGETVEELERYIANLQERIQQLEMEQQLAAQQAARGMGTQAAPNGNLANTGLPQVRNVGNMIRPTPNNIPRQ